MTSILTNQKFIDALKSVENSVRAGWNDQGQKWFPHKSPEGGMPTIAYGHKVLNVQEHEVFKKGITEEQALKLLASDMKTAYDNAQEDWDKWVQNNTTLLNNPLFEELTEKYQGVLVNIAYNTGSLKNRKGVYGWPNLSKRIVAATLDPTDKDKDKAVREGMVTTYLNPKTGKRERLTTRAYQIADSLGIA